MDNVTLGWIVSGVLVPAIGALFTYVMKLQQERVKDLRDIMQQHHDALNIVNDAARMMSEGREQDQRMRERITGFIVTAEQQHKQIIDQLEKRTHA